MDTIIQIFGSALLNGLAILGGVYLGSRLAENRTLKFAEQERESRAQYLAIRVVCELKRYISESFTISAKGNLFFTELKDGKNIFNLGLPLKFPEDIDWKSIDGDLAYEILDLYTTLQDSDKRLEAYEKDTTLADNPEYINIHHFHYVISSKVALEIIEKLRAKYKIPEKNKYDEIIEDYINTTSKNFKFDRGTDEA